MRRILTIVALLTAPALAQVPGSGVIGAGGGTVGGVSGQAGSNGIGSLNALGQVDASQPVASVNGSVRAVDDAARTSARDANKRLSGGKPKAKAAVRADATKRCYADGDTARVAAYDPVFRDGAYRCQATGPGIAAGARINGGN